MPEHDRVAAAVTAELYAAARGRARTARHLRARGPGAMEETLLMALTTVVCGLALIALI